MAIWHPPTPNNLVSLSTKSRWRSNATATLELPRIACHPVVGIATAKLFAAQALVTARTDFGAPILLVYRF
jgi:hypothetical protein